MSTPSSTAHAQRRLRWSRRALAAGALLLVAPGVAQAGPANPKAASGSRATANIVDLPVQFTVQNVNRSLVPCPADGQTYQVQGHIVAPRDRLRDGAATTLYLHGAAVPEATWHLPVAGHDHAVLMARRGHISVTVDRLGYGASGTPHGQSNCVGSQADIAHQIALQLRTASYESATRARFDRIALVGHSAGQVVAQIAASSFDGFDALLVGGWGDPPTPSTAGMLSLAPLIATCAQGGEPKRSGEPTGYGYSFEGRIPELLFHDADPQVIEAFTARHERDPCDPAVFIGSSANTLLVSRVRIPVFLFYALEDALWPADTGERQRRLFVGSDDVTLFEAADTGHMMMLERSAQTFRSVMSSWLTTRGF